MAALNPMRRCTHIVRKDCVPARRAGWAGTEEERRKRPSKRVAILISRRGSEH